MKASVGPIATYKGRLEVGQMNELKRDRALVYTIVYSSVVALIIAAGIILFCLGYKTVSYILFAVAAGGIFRIIYSSYKIKKVWGESEEIFMRERTVNFYRTKLTSSSSGGEAEIEYSEIYKIRKTKSLILFYLLPKNSGRYLALDMTKISGMTPEELEKLISDKE